MMLVEIYGAKRVNDKFEIGADDIHLYRAHTMRLGFRHGLLMLG